MENAHLRIVAMAEKCRGLLQGVEQAELGLPHPLHPRHLLWMCNQIEQNAEDWPGAKLHRWIGFVQCGMMANRILDLEGARAMFDQVNYAYGEGDDEQDLIDHLDPTQSFRADIGGEG